MQSLALADAQREMREVFVNGAIGQGVAGVIWLASAVAAQSANTRAAITIIVVGGAFIFPITQTVLRLSGRPATLSANNPLSALAMQTAFIVPLLLPLAFAAALYNVNWFHPAVMLIVGAHYLPFIFLYGMRSFGVLAIVLMAGAVAIALRRADSFATAAWVTATALLVFAIWAGYTYGRERALARAAVSS